MHNTDLHVEGEDLPEGNSVGSKRSRPSSTIEDYGVPLEDRVCPFCFRGHQEGLEVSVLATLDLSPILPFVLCSDTRKSLIESALYTSRNSRGRRTGFLYILIADISVIPCGMTTRRAENFLTTTKAK